MKIKVAIIILGLIITTISGVKINSLNKEKNDLEVTNMASSEENIVKEENIISENIQVDNDLDANKEAEQITENKQEKVTEQPSDETPKISDTQTKSNTENKKEKVIKNTQESAPKQQTSNSADETTKKEETQVTKTLTPSDLEYWCVAGGSHHIAGDGSNEHGYYKSWDEAYQAFLNYTKNWSSVQYKISQCGCGLYYFWAIQ